jgi:hypothetical protein
MTYIEYLAAAPVRSARADDCDAWCPLLEIIDLVIESHFDVLNPVQWCAGKRSYKEWKDKARKRIALWGGGVNSQVTLPLGTLEDVEREMMPTVTTP